MIKHSFTLCLFTLYLSLVPERSVFFYQHSVKEYIKFICHTPESSASFKKRQSVSLWNFLVNTLLLYILLLNLTDGQNDGQRLNTLAAHGLEELFFQLCCCVSFLVLTRNRFWFYLLCTYVLRVQYSCGVVLVFWFWREIVFGVTYVLSVQHSCAVVSVFWLWQEIVL